MIAGTRRVAAALGVAVACALPAIYLAIHNVSLVGVVPESLAYRYFMSLRVLEDGRDFVFIIQGQALAVAQHAIQLGLSHLAALPTTDLATRLDAFGYTTLALNAALMAAVLWLGFADRRLRGIDLWLIGTLAISSVYSSRSGLSAAMTPDYYFTEAALTVLALVLFLRQTRSVPADTLGRAAALGCIAGVMAATKLTLVASGVLAATPLLRAARCSVGRFGGRAALFAATTIATFLLVTATFYLFHVRALGRFLNRWLKFVENPGGDAGFWATFLTPHLGPTSSGADYGYARLLLALSLVVVFVAAALAWRVERRAQSLLVPLGVTLLGAAHIAGLMRRPAGTTLYEVVLFATLGAAACIAVLPRSVVRTRLAAAFCGVVLLHAGISAITNFPALLPAAALQASGRSAWEIHRWLRAQERPVLVYFPDNRYCGGTVEEVLLKGMCDLPTWNITTGRVLLGRVAPGFSFHQTLATVPPGSAVLWLDVPGESLLAQTPALRDAVARPGTVCRRWELATYPHWTHIANACRIDS
jgi:hypothetical protein